MTNDRSDAQASGSGDHEGHLIPPIWMEENKEAFDAMKAQVEREEARRSDMGVDVDELRRGLQRRKDDGGINILMDIDYVERMCDLLDAKERELAALQAKLDAVKSAHPMVSDAGHRQHCGTCIQSWPCLTIQALDAD